MNILLSLLDIKYEHYLSSKFFLKVCTYIVFWQSKFFVICLKFVQLIIFAYF